MRCSGSSSRGRKVRTQLKFRKFDRSLKDMEKNLVITVSPKGKVTAKKMPEQKPKVKPEKGLVKPVPKKEEVRVKPVKAKKPVDEEAVFKKRSKALEYALVVWGILIVLFMVLFMWNLATTPIGNIKFDKFL